jgi:hypothetical protein
MTRPEHKPKSFIAPRYNLYAYRVRASAASAPIFQDVSANYLKIAQENDIESDNDDSNDPNETR